LVTLDEVGAAAPVEVHAREGPAAPVEALIGPPGGVPAAPAPVPGPGLDPLEISDHAEEKAAAPWAKAGPATGRLERPSGKSGPPDPPAAAGEVGADSNEAPPVPPPPPRPAPPAQSAIDDEFGLADLEGGLDNSLPTGEVDGLKEDAPA